MIRAPIGLSLSGKWQDTIVQPDGTSVSGDVHHNQIQDGAFLVVSGLLANQYNPANEPVGTPIMGGIEYLDVGTGDVSWDDPAVTPPQPETATQLQSAFHRVTLDQNQITFVPDGDPFNGNGVSQTPTNRIRIRVTLGNDIAGSLREFGLFCRTDVADAAASAVNAGLMFNWVIHPLIEKDAALTIERVIEIQVNRG